MTPAVMCSEAIMKKHYCGTAILALVASLPVGGRAAESTAEKSALMRFAEQDYLLGDWGGLRTDLSKRGVDFEFFYVGSFPMNLDGGLERGEAYQGGLLMALTVDSQKLAGYEGGTFNA